MQKKIRLGDLLIEEGYLTKEQVDEAFEEQKKSGGLKNLERF